MSSWFYLVSNKYDILYNMFYADSLLPVIVVCPKYLSVLMKIKENKCVIVTLLHM